MQEKPYGRGFGCTQVVRRGQAAGAMQKTAVSGLMRQLLAVDFQGARVVEFDCSVQAGRTSRLKRTMLRHLNDSRAKIPTCLLRDPVRQSIYSRLAGYDSPPPPSLINELVEAKHQLQRSRALARLVHHDLIALDEVGMSPRPRSVRSSCFSWPRSEPRRRR